MALPGYSVLVRKSGTSTGIVTEPAAIVAGSSVSFRITDSTRRIIDPNVDFHFKDGTTTIAYSAIATMDFLYGEITFTAPLTAAGSCSFSGSYLPITTSSDTVLEARSFKLSCSRDMLDRTTFTGSTTDYVRKRLLGLQDVKLDVESLAISTATQDLGTLSTAMFNGTHIVADIFFGDGNTAPHFRGFLKIANIDTAAAEDGLVTSNIGFQSAAVGASDIPGGAGLGLRANGNPVFAGLSFKVFP